ncbi:alpha/beta hydrolase [Actinomadura madurae]|uniref:alpha/beta hydrolase n=1 Tax=Actinomadura madurae TaxID=1993 RepID=UPI002026CFE5|nr:alpha/beta hydrolase [Actinomadura madurae]URN10811.1 alpha/beta hydrolase [Actinomadura madurae]
MPLRNHRRHGHRQHRVLPRRHGQEAALQYPQLPQGHRVPGSDGHRQGPVRQGVLARPAPVPHPGDAEGRRHLPPGPRGRDGRAQGGRLLQQPDRRQHGRELRRQAQPTGPRHLRQVRGRGQEGRPRFGPFVVWGGLPCVYWPVQIKQQPKPITAKGAAPIVVIGTIRDPATPYKWSQSLADQLSSGVLLTFDGDGHTAYLQGNSCVNEATDKYLVTTDPPKDGATCR